MDELVYALDNRQRRTVGWMMLAALVVLSAAALYLTLHVGAIVATMAWGGVVASVLGIPIYNGGSTAVGPRGVKVRRAVLPPVTVPWDEVTSIDISSNTSGFGTIRMLYLTTESGRTLRLRPLEDGVRRPDPDFDEKCEQIVACWERYA